MSNKGVSVIVCCYNSATLISRTLEHLLAQKVDASTLFEIILVNNNSTDDTVEVAKKIVKKNSQSHTLKIIDEPTPGLSFARRTGIQHAQYDYILFCDDDNWLQNDYLQIAYDLMSENSNIGVLGGQALSVLEGEEPLWWEKQKTNYAVGKQAATSGDISDRSYLWGAGMVIRKQILNKLFEAGFSSLLSDRKGNVLSSGGDSEICKWAMLMGYRLWYSESLLFVHYISNKRLNDEYLGQLLEGHKRAQTLLNLYNWCINKELFKKVNHLTLTEKGYLIKMALKKYLRKENKWKYDLQLALGNTIKIHEELYLIIKTYKRLNI